MQKRHPNRSNLRRTPMAACIAAVFSWGASTAMAANTWTVTSCSDSGAGSLRDTIAAATTLSGDTIDLTHLTTAAPGCDAFPVAIITLTTGAIAIDQTDLTLQGPGVNALGIRRAVTHGMYFYVYDRIIAHTGNGNLRLYGMTIEDGDYLTPTMGTAKGGCVYSKGNVIGQNIAVMDCVIDAPDKGSSYGGAIYSAGSTTLSNSTLSDNAAGVYGDRSIFATYGKAIGGAIFAGGNVTLTGSSIARSTLISHGIGDVAYGAAIHAGGSVTLTNSSISGGSLDSTGTAYGGALHAGGDVSLSTSIISGNTVSGSHAAGGGIWTSAGLTATNSTIDSNRALGQIATKYSPIFPVSIGGGAIVQGNATITASAIVNNVANGHVGGIAVLSEGSGSATTISNSTISGNNAYFIGGAYVRLPATIQNSTIAFNTATLAATQQGATVKDAAVGLVLFGDGLVANFQGVLVSNNIATTASPFTNSTESDLSTQGSTPSFSASSASNLVRVSAMMNLPMDTIEGSCPLLGVLRNNGGPTPTHLLSSRSPAIDSGSAAASGFDQRGAPFVRVSGARADIGAYEVQQSDIVFNSGFDGCQT